MMPASIGCATGVQQAGTKRRRIHGYLEASHSLKLASIQPYQQSTISTHTCSPYGLHSDGSVVRSASIFRLK